MLGYALLGVDLSSDAAGWAGAGLLGMVLSWLLLIHLPAKDKQIRQSIQMLHAVFTECQTRIDEITKNYTEREDSRTKIFIEALAERDRKFMKEFHELYTELRDIGRQLINICRFRSPDAPHSYGDGGSGGPAIIRLPIVDSR